MKTFSLNVLAGTCMLLCMAACSNNQDGPDGPTVEPGPEFDYEITDAFFTGHYYDSFEDEGTANYYVVLTDKEVDSEGYLQPDSYGFFLDIYAAYNEGTHAVPVGEYAFETDVNPSHTPGTFSSFSQLRTTDETGNMNAFVNFTDGKIVVTAEGENYKFDVTLTDETGKRYHVAYTGPATIDPAETPGGGDEVPDIYIKQDYTDLEFTAMGYTYAGVNSGVHNLDIMLVDSPIDPETGEVKNYPCNMLTASIFTYVDQDGQISAGEYVVENTVLSKADKTMEGGALVGESLPIGSYLIHAETDDSASWTYGLVTGGTITVSGTKDDFTLDVNLVINDQYKLTGQYKGTFSVDLPTLSTLTGNAVANLGEYADGTCYGSYFEGEEHDIYDWTITIQSDYITDALSLDIYAPIGEFADGLPSGTYSVNDSGDAFTCVPGYLDGKNPAGCWYSQYANYDVAGSGPAVGGTIEVVNKGYDEYELKLNLVDDLGYTITGEWSGEINFQDYSNIKF